MKTRIKKDISLLTDKDCFAIYSRSGPNIPGEIYCHEDMELTLLRNAKGLIRSVGNFQAPVEHDVELVLLDKYLPHGWFSDKEVDSKVERLTIRFRKDLFSEKILTRTEFQLIAGLFMNAGNGVLFTDETIDHAVPLVLDLKNKMGFDALHQFLAILKILSGSNKKQLLCKNWKSLQYEQKRERTEIVNYIRENIHTPLSAEVVSSKFNLSKTKLIRIFKKELGYTFQNFLLEHRVRRAAQLLMEETLPLTEIVAKCGFSSYQTFYRTFRNHVGVIPSNFKNYYLKEITII